MILSDAARICVSRSLCICSFLSSIHVSVPLSLSLTFSLSYPFLYPAIVLTGPTLSGHHRQSSLQKDLQIITEQASASCQRDFRAWLCEAKRSPGVEILLYICFFITLIFLSLDIKGSTTTFFYADLVEDIIVHEEFDFQDSQIKKTFKEVGEVSEFWAFIHGPLSNAMFNGRQNICEDQAALPSIKSKDCASRRAALFYSDFVLLNIRIKQNRVKRYELNSKPEGYADVCRAPIWMKDSTPDAWNAIEEQGCYPPFASAFEEKNKDGIPFNKTKLHHETVHECFQYEKRSFDWVTTGTIYPYPYSAGGYGCKIDSSSAQTGNATKFLHHLEDGLWLDAGSRMVMIDFTMYSANVDQFLFFRVGVEQAPTGGLVPFWDNYAIKLGDEVTTNTLVFRGLLMFFCCVFFVQEISECCVDGCRKHCRDIWNLLELFNLMLFATYFALLLAAELVLLHERETDNFDIQSIGAIRIYADNILAFNMIFSSLKVFKYIKVSKRMSLMLTTFYEARYSLFALLILVIIFLVGYSMAFYIAFGHRIKGFRSFSRSFITLLNSLLGSFDYQDELEHVNWLLGPLMYFTFQIFVSFVLLSLLIAIIEDAFNTTQKQLEENHEKDELVSALKATAKGMWSSVIGGVQRSAKRARNSASSRIRRSQSEDGRVVGKKKRSFFGRARNTKTSETENDAENNAEKINANSPVVANGQQVVELAHLGDVVNKMGKTKNGGKVNRAFLQAVIQAGEKEKEMERQEMEKEKERKKRRKSSVRFPFFEPDSLIMEEEETKEDTRLVMAAQQQTNHKIHLLENKMDMILASLDAISQSPRQLQNHPTAKHHPVTADKGPKIENPMIKKQERKPSQKSSKSRRSSTVLPPNWKKYRDESSGDAYYQNAETAEVTWEQPKF